MFVPIPPSRRPASKIIQIQRPELCLWVVAKRVPRGRKKQHVRLRYCIGPRNPQGSCFDRQSLGRLAKRLQLAAQLSGVIEQRFHPPVVLLPEGRRLGQELAPSWRQDQAPTGAVGRVDFHHYQPTSLERLKR